jgi:peptidoglycan/LPS O-acetylase OafA/YrhL
MFPMVLMIAAAVKKKVFSLSTLACLIGVLSVLCFWYFAPNGEPRTTALYYGGFLVWLFGAALGYWRVGSKFDSLSLNAKGLTVIVTLMASTGLYLSGEVVLRFLGVILFTSLLIALKSVVQSAGSMAPRVRQLVIGLSDCSFSLYVIHIPILFFVVSLTSEWLPFLTKSWVGFFVFCLSLIAINFLAYLFYLAFERHHLVLNRWILTYMHRQRALR